MLQQAGFSYRSLKRTHPILPYSLTLSGKDGEDAQRYQEINVRKALEDLENFKKQL